MAKITKSVGPKQPNIPADVVIVQMLLSQHSRWSGYGGSRLLGLPLPTGVFDDATAQGIVNFQRDAGALKTPDGIVSPNGFTLRRLSEPVILPPRHKVFNPVCWAHFNDGLKQSDYDAAAKRLGCEAAAIQAVAETEVKGEAWDDLGRPKILFERHYFSELTGRIFDATHPDISNRNAGGYGLERLQYDRLRRAAVLRESAALKSASWGMFQIMGKFHDEAGYATVEAFVDAMLVNQAKHLDAFVSVILARPALLRAIRAKDWTAFARGYNGKDYAKNNYDGKMRSAYNRLTAAAANTPRAAAGR